MKLTYYGHACFGMEINGTKLLLDPFISPNPLASEIDIEKIEADYMLISHGHEDHVSDAIAIAKRTKCKIISNFEIVNWFADQGLDNGHGMNLGGSTELPFGKVKYVTAIHSSVMPDGAYGGNPGGFVFEIGDLCIYYAGDTALTYDMKLIADSFDVDHAILPIGDNFTMGIDDAIRAADFVKCKSAIGMHYNTFPPIEIDPGEAKAKFESADKHLTLMEIGESIEL